MNKFKGELCLFLAALIWGSAFIFQKMGMDHIGPFTFGIFRFGIGALALLPVIWIYDSVNKKRGRSQVITPINDRQLVLGGLWCGIASFVAGSLQQMGLVYTTAGKAGFITAMNIVIVPILLLFLKRRVSKATWIGIALAAIGLYLLCITDGFTLQLGDSFVMLCAVAYAFQILLIDHYAEKVDPIKLSCLQFIAASLLSIPAAIILETIELGAILDCAIPILYVAVLEVSVAFTLQIVGQRYTPPAIAAIIMSLESVFAALCGALLLGETMTMREITGCILMFIAFIISQLPDKKTYETNHK